MRKRQGFHRREKHKKEKNPEILTRKANLVRLLYLFNQRKYLITNTRKFEENAFYSIKKIDGVMRNEFFGGML